MVKGLPGTPEAVAWLRETFDALQRSDSRPDVDLGGVECRLAHLEGRALGERFDASAILGRLDALEKRTLFDPSALWDAIGALARRVALLEERPPTFVMARDPLDPEGWDSLDAAKAALEVLVTQEAARRCGQAVSLYEFMVRLDALGDARTSDEDFQLLQHHEWAKERQQVELARLTHNCAIRGLADLGDALAYDWKSGWPEV